MRVEIKYEKRDIRLIVAIVVAYALTLIPSILWTVWPHLLDVYVNLFLFPSCTQTESIPWWFKDLFDRNLAIVIPLCLGLAFKNKSRLWFFVCVLMTEYAIMDFLSFICNYTSTLWTYYINGFADIIIIIWFIYGKKESNLKAV